MKAAVKILVIIAAVVGIVWAIVGFFGLAFAGGTAAAFEKSKETAQKIVSTTAVAMMKLVGSFIVITAGLIFGIIASGKEVNRIAGIILGALLIICGVAATLWASYAAGPLYILCGILVLAANAAEKPKAAEEKKDDSRPSKSEQWKRRSRK